MVDGARAAEADACVIDAAPVIKTLLRGAVDYAGLFPPAALDMATAVGHYADYHASAEAWALGRFVLPAARLEEFEQAGAASLPREASRSWALSALAGSDLEEDVARIESFNERHRDARQGAVYVDTVELKTPNARDVGHASDLLDRRFDTYMEVPVANDPGDVIAAIRQTLAKAKIRTGGVTAEAFPTSEQIARFIKRCVDHGVAFKATAGLHHPLRADYALTYASDSPSSAMFGFLNVFLATAALHAGRSERDAVQLLEEHDPAAIRFDAKGVTWHGATFDADAIVRARESITSFGSCSFEEPIAGLRELHLL